MTTHTDTKPSRYLFDEVFALDVVKTPQAAPAISTAVHDAAVAAARAEGHAAGLAEGRRQAEDAITARIAASLDTLCAGMTGLVDRAAADRLEIEATAVEMARCTAMRLAPGLVAREPAAELDLLLAGCLADIREVPHIAVRVSEDLVEDMRARIDTAAIQAGFTGTIIVLGQPDIAPGDGRIEWADGGIVRDMAATKKAIETAVSDYLAATGATTNHPPDDSPPDDSPPDDRPADPDMSPDPRDQINE